MKINESEVSSGNASGKAGIASLPFGRGYYSSGGNNGAPGIAFTPSGEPSYKTYKSMKHSKKNLKKRKMKKFEEFINKTKINDKIIEMGVDTFTVGELIENLKKYELNDKIYHIISKNDKNGYCVTEPITDYKIIEEIMYNNFIIIPHENIEEK